MLSKSRAGLVVAGVLLVMAVSPVGASVLKDAKDAHDVLVANTVAVQLATSPTNPLFVRAAPEAVEPFQRQVNLPIAAVGDVRRSSFTVPPGKRLVIDYVSGRPLCEFVPRGPTIQTTVGGATATHNLALGNFSNERVFGLVVRLFADPSTEVVVETEGGVGACSSSLAASGYLAVSGHLLDVP